jgi:hypothetical protein
VAVGDQGNIYAGKDGNAYRRQDGTWQKYENGGWSNTDRQPSGERPTPNATTRQNQPTDRTTSDRGTIDQLNRDAAARATGTQRTRDYGGYSGGSGMSGTGSYRGGGASRGGGMSRGGGGRRR